MAKKILIMGLSGSGKTTLAEKLQKKTEYNWLNADVIRKAVDDWEFSNEARLRQANRLSDLSKHSTTEWVIVDFICPQKATREAFKPDLIIWMDTKQSSQYKDTDSIWEAPEKYDLRFKSFKEVSVEKILKKIEEKSPANK